MKVAYVDVEGSATPQAIGQVQGTPTIKAFVPRRVSATHAKEMIDYEQAREVSDLVRFATSRMPSYVESVSSTAELVAFEAKAREWGLPRVLVFGKGGGSGQTSSTLKALSAEYRRRVLIGERAQRNEEAVRRHAVSAYPTLICIKPAPLVGGESGASGGGELRFEGKDPTYRRLDSFLTKCALRKPVVKKPLQDAKEHAKEEL